METILDVLQSLIQPTSVIIIIVVAYIINRWIFNKLHAQGQTGITLRRTIASMIIFVGVISFIIALPIDNELKGQILSFLGIILSAGIALSSTTILGNMIAGFMNSVMKRYKIGDLIRINDMTGRLSGIGILHIEIQLEDSNFMSLPNLYVATHPLKLIKKANTVISTSVSLGYDVDRNRIKSALIDAALEVGLKDPFVYVTSLGDFSITYKIHGFLSDSSSYFTMNSKLNELVLDRLHQAQIEIVSPTFMNQRRVDETIFIPKATDNVATTFREVAPEELIFEDALKSEELDKKIKFQSDILVRIKELDDALDDAEEEKQKTSLAAKIERLKSIKEKLELQIDELKNK